MTKQEKIAEAYGEYWSDIKEVTKQAIISQNGWEVTPVWKNIKNIPYDWKSEFIGFMRRPTSIRNIEHNNGWTEIKSEIDLPKEKGYYLCLYKDGDIIPHHFSVNSEFDNELFIQEFTHYQPLQKPKQPIY